jgi:hypothetical protein
MSFFLLLFLYKIGEQKSETVLVEGWVSTNGSGEEVGKW